jgi:hypothetical protein
MTEEEEKKIELLFEFINVTAGNDIAQLNNYYSELNHDLAQLIEAMYENKENSLSALELSSKLIRLYHNNESIMKLSNGYPGKFRDKPFQIYDLSSVYNLSRQLIESFIITFYLYFAEITTVERELRVLVYKINGLKRQIKLTDRVDNGNAQRKAMKEELDGCIEGIKTNDYYNNRTEKEKKTWLQTSKSPMLVDRGVTLEEAGLGDIIQQWILFSNYAHSEYISDRQYNEFFGNELKEKQSICTVVNVNCRLTARLIYLIKEKFSFGEEVFDSLPIIHQERIQFWNKSSESQEMRREL